MTTRVRNLRETLYVSWVRYDFLIEELTCRVRDLSFKNLKYVYGIPRGGAVIAVCLSHRLDLEYKGPEVWDRNFPLDPDNTLVVDDICDTGETISPFEEWPTATLFVRSTLPLSQRPMVYCTEVDKNLHVQFPYESPESTL